MPVLENPQHENFAFGVAQGLSPAAAYVAAGFSAAGARQSAHRLLGNMDVSARVLEIRTQISNEVMAGTVDREIQNRNARLAELQQRWDMLRDALDCIITERGAQFGATAAGGSTGLVTEDFRGQTGTQVFVIDGGVLRLVELLLEHERRAAEETGQWSQKHRLQQQQKRPDLSKLTNAELALWMRLYEKAKPPETAAETGALTVNLK